VTFGAYSNSANPRFGKSFCHPMRMHKHDKSNKVLDENTAAIMEITIPEFCLRPGDGSWRKEKEAQMNTNNRE
jgi:hypothetical protein